MKIWSAILFLTLIIFTSCNEFSKNSGNKIYGEKFDTTKAVPVADMLQKMNGATRMDFTIKGKVTDVCKSEGCWVNLDEGNGKKLYVDTKEKFYLPQDVVGKEIVVNGFAYQDTTSVEQLKGDAKEDGKSQADIDKITSPEIEVSFVATGVKIK